MIALYTTGYLDNLKIPHGKPVFNTTFYFEVYI